MKYMLLLPYIHSFHLIYKRRSNSLRVPQQLQGKAEALKNEEEWGVDYGGEKTAGPANVR